MKISVDHYEHSRRVIKNLHSSNDKKRRVVFSWHDLPITNIPIIGTISKPRQKEEHKNRDGLSQMVITKYDDKLCLYFEDCLESYVCISKVKPLTKNEATKILAFFISTGAHFQNKDF